MENKLRLIAAPQLIDRGTWIHLDKNSEPFTKENAIAQLKESPLNYLNNAGPFQKLKNSCEYSDLGKKIAELQNNFVKDVFDGKKERFWSYVADDYLEKYFAAVEKEVKNTIMQNRPFLAIGGSHSIAWPINRAIFNHYSSMRDKISIIFFDEHEDNYGAELEKIRPSMYHGAWAEIIRRKFNYAPFQIRPENFDSAALASELKGKKFLHLSVDIDVFSSEITPSTFYSRFDETFGTGTMTKELFNGYIAEIKKIADENYIKILGCDVSEFVPYGHTTEENKRTAEFAAMLLNRMAELMK